MVKKFLKRKSIRYSLIALITLIFIAIISIPVVKANQPRDFDTNSIIYGGAYSISELRNNINNGTGKEHQGGAALTHFFNTLGIDDGQFGKLTNGSAHKDGRVTVDGKTVHNGSRSAGREFMPGSSKDDRFSYPIYWRSTGVSFAADSIPAFVYLNADGSMAYAIIKSCGNPILGAGVKIPHHRITVKKYNDLNGDGTRQGSEPWLSGWTFHIKGPNQDTTHTTGSDGETAFINLEPGTYTITERQKDGWECTTCKNGSLAKTVSGGNDETLAFGNKINEVNPKLYYCSSATGCTSTTAYKDAASCKIGVGLPCYTSDSSCKATAATYCSVPNPKLYYCSTESSCNSTDSYDTTSECKKALGLPCYTSESACMATTATYCPLPEKKFKLEIIKFNDINGNSTLDNGESYLPGWSFKVTGKNLDSTITTDSNGRASLSDLAAGDYKVSELIKDGWKCTTGLDKSVTIKDGDERLIYGNQKESKKYIIEAKKFEDINGNSLRDTDENWLSGWKVKLTGNGLVIEYATDSDGRVVFRDLSAGTYTLTEEMQVGWTNITPTTRTVTLPATKTIDGYVEFGNQKIPQPKPPEIVAPIAYLPVTGPVEMLAGTLAVFGIGAAGYAYRKGRLRLYRARKKF